MTHLTYNSAIPIYQNAIIMNMMRFKVLTYLLHKYSLIYTTTVSTAMAASAFEFLASPFFNKPVSPDPYATHWVVGINYKLHTMTGSLLFFSR